MKHIIIRGARGAGKSTLIRHLLAETGAIPGGFVTFREAPDADGISYTHIYPAGTRREERLPTAQNRVGGCRDRRMVSKQPDVFDTVGTACLKDTAGIDVLVMDELGFLEEDATLFKQAVLCALDGDIPLIAAVKDKPGPFRGSVLRHPNAQVFDITPDNRDTLFSTLLPILKDRL